VKRIAFDGTFDGWRAAARSLLASDVAPDSVDFLADFNQQASLLAVGSDPLPLVTPSCRVPREFLDLAREVTCFRDESKWLLLYRVLWRLTHGERSLLVVSVDPDVHRLNTMKRAIGRDVHKMHAFVRFKRVEVDGIEQYVAWFVPKHLIVERAAPFFAKRFASMRWTILTPDRCADWDGEELQFAPGVSRSQAPRADELDTLWRTYYASIFNPARVSPSTMQREMPRRYWENLPEASLIPGLIAEAPGRVRRMIESERQQVRPGLKSATPNVDGSL
jgi:DNA polymerase